MSIDLDLDPFERELVLRYGYPSPELQSRLRVLSNSGRSEIITFDSFDIEMVSGDLARSMNHGEVPRAHIDAVYDLCSRLEVYL